MIWIPSVAAKSQGYSEYFASPQGVPANCAAMHVTTPYANTQLLSKLIGFPSKPFRSRQNQYFSRRLPRQPLRSQHCSPMPKIQRERCRIADRMVRGKNSRVAIMPAPLFVDPDAVRDFVSGTNLCLHASL